MLAVAGLALFALAPQDPDERARAVWRLFEERQELTVLVDSCALVLGVPVEYDPAVVKGEVTARLTEPVSALELWAIANRALGQRGLTSVQPPGSEGLSVVAIADAGRLARMEQDLSGTLAGFVKVLVPLRHAEPEKIAEAVRMVLSKDSALTPLRDSRALVVADYRAHVEQALVTIGVLDSRPGAAQIEEVRLENTAPVSLVALLESIRTAEKAALGAAPLGTVIAHPERRSVLVIAPGEAIPAWRERIERFDRRETLVTLNYVPRRFGLAQTASLVEKVVEASAPAGWKMVPDELTGTLIVTAGMSTHREIDTLLGRLEEAESGPRQEMRAYPVKNRGVKELADLLGGLIERGILDESAEEASPAPVRAAAPRPVAAPEPELTLTPDESTNRLIAMGEGRVLDQLEHLIETLDVRATQVLVEALVLSLTENQARDLGIELQGLVRERDARVKLASVFGLGSPDPSSNTLPAAGTGFTGVVLNPGDFSAVVRALETVNEGRSLTIPKVLVNNNQEASLGSVLQTPYISTNASQTVATTSLGGTLDAGTEVTVRPQIAEGDQLVLDYTVSVSTFVGEPAAPTLPPPRQENSLHSVATVPDGYTVVVGGLEVETDSEGASRVPWLGSVPIVGRLFESRSKTRTKSRFFVFLRCSVLRNGSFEDLRWISARELDDAGLDDGWPVLEARVIR